MSHREDTLGRTDADKAAEYIRYAEQCVEAARTLRHQDARSLHREMAAEWIRLAQQVAEGAAFGSQPNRKRRKSGQG